MSLLYSIILYLVIHQANVHCIVTI